MAAPCVSACGPWATQADLCSPCDDYQTIDPTLLDDMLAIATDVLYELSGKRFPGACQETVRPCARSLRDDPWPDRTAQAWNRTWGSCGCQRDRSCGCSSLPAVALGGYPLIDVSEVKVDGEVLTSNRYRIDDYRLLVRLADADGTNPGWPCCQRLDLADSEPETWSVTYTYGMPAPPAGVKAAAILACELALSCQPETANQCRLPKRVTSITRQGITAVVLDPFDFLDDGKTGIYEVDLFLKTYNPKGRRSRAHVISPDIPRRIRRAGT